MRRDWSAIKQKTSYQVEHGTWRKVKKQFSKQGWPEVRNTIYDRVREPISFQIIEIEYGIKALLWGIGESNEN